MTMPPLWRKAFDAIERPLAAGSEAWIQSETFMDLATHTIRVQRRLLRDMQGATERWLHLFGYVSRGDVLRLSNQVASLERQIRDLRREADNRDRPLLNGHQPGARTRTRPRVRQSSSSNRRTG
jgi:hypothetical protein